MKYVRLTLLSAGVTLAIAQSAFSQSEWQVHKGKASTVKTTADSVHIDQLGSTDSNDYSWATQPLGFREGENYALKFRFRYGVFRAAGTSIRVLAKAKPLVWIHGDTWYGAGVLNGKDNSNLMPFRDSAWHSFELTCIGDETTLTVDNRKLLVLRGAATPDTLYVGTENHVPSHQTEVEVQSIKYSTTGSIGATDGLTLEDDFAPSYNPSIWSATVGASRTVRIDRGLRLMPSPNGLQYPYLEVRGNLLPTQEKWKLSIECKFDSIGPYGVGVGFKEAGQAHSTFFIHADSATTVPKLLGAWAGSNHNKALSASDWHLMEVESTGAAWVFRVDKEQVGQISTPGGAPTFYIGTSAVMANVWGWSEISIRNFQITYSGTVPAAARIAAASAENVAAPATPLTNPPLTTPTVDPPPRVAPVKLGAASRFLAVFGLDSRAEPPAVPVAGSRLRVSARRSTVICPPGATLEFQPRIEASDFSPAYVAIKADDKVLRTEPYFGRGPLPVMSYVPTKASGFTVVKIFGVDDKKREVELLSAQIWPSNRKATGAFALTDGTVKVEGLPKDARGAYIFLEEQYLGRIQSSDEEMKFDARRLPMGQHRFTILYTLDDGSILAPVSSTITIRPRFSIDSVALNGEFVTQGWESKLPVRIEAKDTGINKVRLYINHRMVYEADAASFNAEIPTESLRSGDLLLEVIGIGKDGQAYAPETAVLKLRNGDLDRLSAQNERRRNLHKMIDGISEYDQAIVYWYQRALSEPAFRTYASGRSYYTIDEFGRMGSIGYVDAFTVQGDPGKYLAECKAAIVRRSEYRMKIGREQAALGMRSEAKWTFEQVIYEVGENSGLGTAARQELAKLQP